MLLANIFMCHFGEKWVINSSDCPNVWFRIFMFLINPPSGNVTRRIQKLIAKHIFKCFEKRKGEDDKVNTQGLLSP